MALATKYYTSLTPKKLERISQGTPDQAHLASIYVTVSATKARWIQFFNQDLEPILGDVPHLVHYQPKKAENLIVVYQQPIRFELGVWWASSKSPGFYDPVAAGENVVLLQAHYY